ncbi:hypothetical protein Tcan_15129 [Toxocara canis]|uniref:Uncharacterized protein n=1 Tax=Toxocara canis TaxID=6265 RepID=A0A0B2VBQ0_TOXCA|nr:hypothetical protein Tcan_15129 [Toxocara canis]
MLFSFFLLAEHHAPWPSMWESHLVESCSGRDSIFGGASNLSSSMAVSSSSPRLSSSEAPTCSVLDERRQRELDTISNEEMLVPPVHDDQSSSGAVSWQLLSVTLRRVGQFCCMRTYDGWPVGCVLVCPYFASLGLQEKSATLCRLSICFLIF